MTIAELCSFAVSCAALHYRQYVSVALDGTTARSGSRGCDVQPTGLLKPGQALGAESRRTLTFRPGIAIRSSKGAVSRATYT